MALVKERARFAWNFSIMPQMKHSVDVGCPADMIKTLGAVLTLVGSVLMINVAPSPSNYLEVIQLSLYASAEKGFQILEHHVLNANGTTTTKSVKIEEKFV